MHALAEKQMMIFLLINHGHKQFNLHVLILNCCLVLHSSMGTVSAHVDLAWDLAKKKGSFIPCVRRIRTPPRAHDVGIRHITIVRADLRPSSGLEAVAVKLFLVSGHVACAPN